MASFRSRGTAERGGNRRWAREGAEAASILLAIAAREEAVAAQIDLFDTTSPEAARQLLALWRRDPAYRAALGRLAA